jgi:lipoprotein-anchoring transpeptidase ErfK/SrfK
MIRWVLFPVLATGLLASAATARAAPVMDQPATVSDGVLVPVQYRDAESYIDRNGNRVIVDAVTGKVIAVQPRGYYQREQRRAQRQRDLGRAPRDQDRFYLDDPDDVARLRRLQGREYDDQGYPNDDYGAADPGYDSGDYGSGDDGYPRDYGADEFPPAPRDAFGKQQPSTAERIERAPLNADPVPGATALDPAPRDPELSAVEPRDGSVMPAPAEPQTTGTISPSPDPTNPPAVSPPITSGARENVAGLQILLDRTGASPGVIDGKFGSNVDKALVAYRMLTGKNLKSTDTATIKAELAATGGDPFMTYEITAVDAAGPYVASIPEDYSQKAQLPSMAFTSVPEMLAERFHMDEGYLRALNPEANFSRPGTIIRVANVGQNVTGKKVARITADKRTKQVFAYDAYDKLVAAYPATIGSSDTPSPTGTHAVSRIAFDPNYTYNPKVNFKQGENDKVLTIPPGPNGPVGSIWIALDKPTYGIHGTPEPSKIGKTQSHGCIRLTNWDAYELAKMVSAGVTVEFLE